VSDPAAPTTGSERVTLRDGSRIAIRPVRPGDKSAIAAGFDRLSPRSRYRRFFAPLEELSDRDLAYLTEVDHRDHEALIAFHEATGEPVGVVRYIRVSGTTEAEVAVVVVDDWQGRGIATALLDRLVDRAREQGITHFLALVQTENVEAIRMFEDFAPTGSESRRSASGHLELVIELPAPGTPTDASRLGRALRAAARGALQANPWSVIRERIRDNRPLR
jgi:GNAT superfamily N-acetyltransferase